MNGPIEPITRLPQGQSLRRVERHPRPADEREHPCDRVEIERPDAAGLMRLMLQVLADSLEDPQVSAEAHEAEAPETARDLAAWLLQAVNGILVSNFLDREPEPAPEVFDYFVTEIRADLQSGAIEVEEVFQSLGVFDDWARETRDASLMLVEDALVRFAADAAQELREARRLSLSAKLD